MLDIDIGRGMAIYAYCKDQSGITILYLVGMGMVYTLYHRCMGL